MEFLTKYAKGFVALVLPILVNMVMDLVNGTAPWPQNQQEWLRYVLSSVVVALGVVGVRNTTTDPQVAKTQSVTLKKPKPGRHARPEPLLPE